MSIQTSNIFKDIHAELKDLLNDSASPWNLLKGGLKDYFKNKKTDNIILGDVSDKAIIEGDGIFIHETAKVEAYSYIKGPCYIGANTEVRHGAYLRGNVFIGDNCVVGHSTEVKHSVFLNGAKAGHFNYIGDSVLGSKVNLGAGTKLANLKITSGTVVLKINGERVDSELKKFGSLIGDSCETGCNSVLNPGTILAPKSLIFPNSSASGVHLKRVILK